MAFPYSPQADQVYTVSQLTSEIKGQLESHFSEILVEGEISGLRNTSGKHLYFSLKDDTSLIKVVWFSWASRTTARPPADGDKVRVWGRLSVYEPQGQYQLVISRLETAGLGDILARLEQLKQKLAHEGLFEASRRKPIPVYPQVIGLVTSSAAAALQDMLRIFQQNEVPATIRIFPVSVQGVEAPERISRMIEYVNQHHLAEVLIVGRGGGSFEDLLAFSEEGVVRAVSASKIPVISAVGHETDSPLCDWAADLRCPTPTAAAEWLSRPWRELTESLKVYQSQLEQNLRTRLERTRAALSDFRADRLQVTFERLLQPRAQRLDEAQNALLKTWEDKSNRAKNRWALANSALQALNPGQVLDRGFAFVTRNNRAVTSAAQAREDKPLTIHWKDGYVKAEIEEPHEEF